MNFGSASHTVNEGDSVTVTVTLSAAPERSVVIPLTTTELDGASNADYSGVPAELTFAGDEVEQTFTLTATEDTEDDAGERVTIGFGSLLAAVSAGSTAETAVVITEGTTLSPGPGVPALTPLIAGSNGPPSEDPMGDTGVPPSSPECLRGEIAEGFSLVVYEGGSVEGLAACAQSRNVTSVYVLADGEWVSYILGAPEFVNEDFAAVFPDGLPALTPLVAKSPVPTANASQAGAANR